MTPVCVWARDAGSDPIGEQVFDEPSPENAIALSDSDLAEVNAGDFQMHLDEFDVVIQNNEAGLFNLDIAQDAFNGAQGLFTTVQAVNSAVNLNVIVNIFLNGQQQGS